MRIKTAVMLGCVLISHLVSACNPTAQTVEVTRIVPQTVMVTQLVKVPITTTPVSTDTPIPAKATPSPTESLEPTRVFDLSDQDGCIVIVQYYTLIDLHLYEQAYDLLSNDAKSHKPKEQYLAGEKMGGITEIV